MRVIFLGTPDFAVPVLKGLMEKHNVLAVISQPDKPSGRGKRLLPTPVKAAALEAGIEVLQPESIKAKEFIEKMKQYNADIFVVAAYGQLLTEEFLKLPKYGCVNVHASLLPKYRGAAPIQQAVIDGERVTGVTVMYMVKRLDAGDMILKKEVPIEEEDTFGTMHDKLSAAGAEALLQALELIENGQAKAEAQNESLSCYAHKITKDMGRIDFNRSSREIINLIRGLNPYPCAFTFYKGGKLKVFRAVMGENAKGSIGEVLFADKRGICVKTADGSIIIKEIQAGGSKRMDTGAYLRGHSVEAGSILGEE